jgi:hypothetical protein
MISVPQFVQISFNEELLHAASNLEQNALTDSRTNLMRPARFLKEPNTRTESDCKQAAIYFAQSEQYSKHNTHNMNYTVEEYFEGPAGGT